MREQLLSVARRYAAAGFDSTCTITRTTTSTLDEATGSYTPNEVTVWQGPCTLQLPTPRVFARASEDQLLTEQQPILKVPVEGTGGITVGDVATITANPADPSMVGLKVKVAGVHPATYASTRRLPVYAITEVLNG